MAIEKAYLSQSAIEGEIVIRRDAVVQNTCDVVITQCIEAFGDRIEALILTGSAARGESTIVSLDGGWKVLGDAEFLLVLRETSTTTDAKLSDVVKRDSMEKLRSQGILVVLDIGVVTESYLKKLPPHIFSYELRACGKIVSGDPRKLELIPRYTAGMISKEDAWRLLCNRMIEQLKFVHDLENSPFQLTPSLYYATVKLYLDMASSYLVFAGEYAPTYRERAQRLNALANKARMETPFPLRKFAARVAECTAWKLSGEEEDSDRRLEVWLEAVSYLRRLWRWELIQLTTNSQDTTIAGLTSHFSSQQSLSHRIRGWISLVKRSGWLRSISEWPRWLSLAFRSTPRYLVYQSAAEVAFRLPCLIKHGGQPPRLNVDWREIRSRLPVLSTTSNSISDSTWLGLVNDILWNYSHFLQDTRA